MLRQRAKVTNIKNGFFPSKINTWLIFRLHFKRSVSSSRRHEFLTKTSYKHAKKFEPWRPNFSRPKTLAHLKILRNEKGQNTRTSKTSKSKNTVFCYFNKNTKNCRPAIDFWKHQNRPFPGQIRNLPSEIKKFNKFFDFSAKSAEKYNASKIALAIFGHKMTLFWPFWTKKALKWIIIQILVGQELAKILDWSPLIDQKADQFDPQKWEN